MKRHQALQPLSRDHHVALVAAQRLRRAGADDADDARAVFLEFWNKHGAHHFRVEEDVLLPAFAAYGDPADERIVQMLVQHVRIRAATAALAAGDADLEEMHALGTALEQHVRLEEREVFPLIEATLPEQAAERLVDAVLGAETRS
ncbi:MAG TPA: hemerythrin domain-containing protein [Solirubrobacteraceae bacterium]|nr:hemerythrin domain-containing protein [Solirubrobacteraceae bacterium]